VNARSRYHDDSLALAAGWQVQVQQPRAGQTFETRDVRKTPNQGLKSDRPCAAAASQAQLELGRVRRNLNPNGLHQLSIAQPESRHDELEVTGKVGDIHDAPTSRANRDNTKSINEKMIKGLTM